MPSIIHWKKSYLLCVCKYTGVHDYALSWLFCDEIINHLSCSGIQLNFTSDFFVREKDVEQSLSSCIQGITCIKKKISTELIHWWLDSSAFQALESLEVSSLIPESHVWAALLWTWSPPLRKRLCSAVHTEVSIAIRDASGYLTRLQILLQKVSRCICIITAILLRMLWMPPDICSQGLKADKKTIIPIIYRRRND